MCSKILTTVIFFVKNLCLESKIDISIKLCQSVSYMANKLYQARFRANPKFWELVENVEQSLPYSSRQLVLQEAYEALAEKIEKEKLIAQMDIDEVLAMVKKPKNDPLAFLDDMSEEEGSIWIKNNIGK